MKIENGINALVEAVHYAPCGRYKTFTKLLLWTEDMRMGNEQI